MLTIWLEGDKELARISEEINMVIKSKVEEIVPVLGLDNSAKSALERKLLSITYRTYL